MLTGEWEVGLAEIAYPQSWYNIRRDDNMEWRIRYGERPDQHVSFSLLPGVYKRAQDVLTEMHNLMQSLHMETKLTLRLNPISQKLEFYVNGAMTEVYFSAAIADVLGLGKEKTNIYMPQGAYSGHYTLDLHHGFYSLYVYCDLVRARPVGDTMTPLLRTVPIKNPNTQGRDGTTIRSEVFTNVYFLPLQKKTFQNIEVDIRDDTGKPVPFESGKVELTIVFRQVRGT